MTKTEGVRFEPIMDRCARTDLLVICSDQHQRSDNRLSNLRYVTRAENQRNTYKNDSCEKRLGVHSYEDYKEYNKRNHHDWYMRNRDAINAKRRKERSAV